MIEAVKKHIDDGKERGVADAYCYDVYSSTRRAGVIYLRNLADNYGNNNTEIRDKLYYGSEL